jgi:hypothetical protein
VLLALVVVAFVAVVLVDRIVVGRLELAALTALLGLAIWSVASAAWSPGAEAPVRASELVLVYVGGVAALVVGLTRARVPWLLAGLIFGAVAVAVAGLETRLLDGDLGTPGDLLSGTRLVHPLGYANAVGAFAALGLLLGLGGARSVAQRSLRVAASVALVPLAAALYFTLSRGSVVALAAGLVVLALSERSRASILGLALLLVAPLLGAVACWLSPLTRSGLEREAALDAGHRLALALLVAALLAAAVALALPVLAARAARWLPALGGAVVAALAVVILLAGPVRLVEQAVDRVQAPPPATGTDLNRRVLSVSGSGRTAYWRVAWDMVERAPLLGTGAGSYERWWLQERPVPHAARNAHNLYLETLAELGPIGLALLLLALGLPLRAARRASGGVATTALAAYVAWLVHAALDWDWQIPAVTLPGLACGAALLVLAREGQPLAPRRSLALAPLGALLLAAFVMHVGNRAADAAEHAVARGESEAALAETRRARTWMPWAGLPWQLAGEAQLAAGDDAAARASLERAVERDPASWSIWYDLAAVTDGQRHAEALRRARALNPLAPELAAAG